MVPSSARGERDHYHCGFVMSTFLSDFASYFRAPWDTARSYSLAKGRADGLAGLTVAVLFVPQSMAYALIAGVDAQYGLYTAIIQSAIGALFSASDHPSIGPTNTQSLLIAATVSRLVPQSDPQSYIALVTALALLKGIVQLAFAAARMGNLVRYVSRSVIVGFTAGAGVLIAVGQVPSFLGVDIREQVSTLPGVLATIARTLPVLHTWHWESALIGTMSLLLLIGAARLPRWVPGPLLSIIIGAVAVALLGWTSGELPLVGPLPSGAPPLAVPPLTFEVSRELFSGAVAIALLGMIESVAIAKSIAVRTGQRIDANQEFFGQGLSNVVSSFMGCIPGSGSFTRSALSYASGGQTRFSALYAAAFVAIIFYVLAPEARYIPLSSLAALLFVIAWSLIDWRHMMRLIRTSRNDALVCFITFASALLLPLEYAIYVGIFLNVGLYLHQASRLHVAEMVSTTGGTFIERPLHVRTGDKGDKQVMFLQVEGDLFFGVADELSDRLASVTQGEVRIVILRLKRCHSIDTTVLQVLEQFTKRMKERGGHVVLCGLKREMTDRIKAYGLADIIGRDNIFETGFGVFTSAKQALQRARQLLGSSIDAAGLDLSDEADSWYYQI